MILAPVSSRRRIRGTRGTGCVVAVSTVNPGSIISATQDVSSSRTLPDVSTCFSSSSTQGPRRRDRRAPRRAGCSAGAAGSCGEARRSHRSSVPESRSVGTSETTGSAKFVVRRTAARTHTPQAVRARAVRRKRAVAQEGNRVRVDAGNVFRAGHARSMPKAIDERSARFRSSRAAR